jgi:hypothetical protein
MKMKSYTSKMSIGRGIKENDGWDKFNCDIL